MSPISQWLGRRLFYIVGGIWFGCLPAWADTALPQAMADGGGLIPLYHTSWLPKDGAPPYVTALAQTKDGWIWVGSSTGLYRFDGVRFERFQPGGVPLPSTYISSLTVLPDDSVWVGYLPGGLTEIRDGRVAKHYPQRREGMNGTIYEVAVDAQGHTWAGGAGGLYRLSKGEFGPIAAEEKAPKAAIDLLLDRQGGFWVRSKRGIFHRPAGSKVFEAVPGDWNWGALIEAQDGSIWASDVIRGGVNMLRAPDNGAAPQVWQSRPGPSNKLIFDKKGRLWNTRVDGVEMMQANPGPQPPLNFGLPQGLSGDTGTALLADREGNVWVGTQLGLDRFRENKLSRYPISTSFNEALPLVVGRDGVIWTDRQIITDPALPPQPYDKTPVTGDNYSRAQFMDTQGRLWTHYSDALTRVEKTAQGYVSTVIPPPPPPDDSSVGSEGLGIDGEGTLWVTFGHKLFCKKNDGIWLRKCGHKDVAKGGYNTVYVDTDGSIWFGSAQSALIMISKGKLRTFGPPDGLELGMVLQLYRQGKTLWVSGENGLAYFDGQRFHSVLGRGDEAFVSTSGITTSDDGDLWLNSGLGIFRIPHAEQVRALADPAYRVNFSRLGYEDGLLGASPQSGNIRSAVTAKGKVWFSTTAGLFWIDPTNTLHNDVVPTVVIRGVRANDVSYAAQAGLQLPKGTRQIVIDYTALSLTMPEQMQFRYRLDGFEQEWQTVRNQRAATYTNLAPGDYRFQVQASNNDGVWNETGATLAFSILPTLQQTTWFKCLVIFFIIMLAWLLHRLRLMQMASRVRERLGERLDERERIARELHDTLLQSVQGLVLVFSAAAKRMKPADESELLTRALKMADDVIEEGRNRVYDLRQDDQVGGLFDQLREYGAMLAETHAVEFRHSVIGEPRKLFAIIGEECRAIGKEALANAFQHAAASSIQLQVQYGASELRITISDNGGGIPQDVQQAGGREGHWGLTGMRERASKIKGKLSCSSIPERGTTVQLSVPARLAYEYGAGRSFWRRLLQD
ncbi:sensor histidine kinase [Chitinimonas naiadis]